MSRDSWQAVLFRVILQVLLRDRDLILAENIKKVCQKKERCEKFLLITLATCGSTSQKDSGSIVAVLGAAHCNGVRRLGAKFLCLPRCSCSPAPTP